MKRLVIAMTGASGALYGVRLLEQLKKAGGVETHLMISDAAALNLHHELDIKRKEVESLANVVHSVRDIGACVASGSFQSDGMVIAPCSMKTLASVAHGMCDNLISRAADVMLKERRRLILMVRETPFNLAHLRNMTAVTEMGGVIFPPLPALYQRPQTVSEMVDHTVGRVLDLLSIEQSLAPEWTGLKAERSQ
jgi:4-hydroxy-3-polyprenylbenzoate decarboxylase